MLDRYRTIRYCTDIERLYRYRHDKEFVMEAHVFLTHQAVRSLDGLTAFSALPDAPVLPYKERRRRLSLNLPSRRQRGRRPVARLAAATTAGPCA